MFINVFNTPLLKPVGFAVTSAGLSGTALTGFVYLSDCVILRDSDGNPVLDSNGNEICLPS